MIHKIINSNNLSDEMISKYFSMLSETRQKKIAGMTNITERRNALCCEMLARQCLSELCDAPEFAFELLCNPGGKSIVGNFDAQLCLVTSKESVGCAVSTKPVGMGLTEIKPFSFFDAQKIFSDSEIRCIFSESKYSFAELVNLSECNEHAAMQKFAVMKSLKDAHFYASGRGIRSEIKNTTFEFDGSKMVCSDSDAIVRASYIDSSENLAISIIERCKR